MAENRAVWGIDIGQAGLKAVRLKYAAQAEQALAVAYDYIPHPKILSQPDAIPRELIKQALETFLSRNDVTGDLIAISLPGHSALARFIQLQGSRHRQVRSSSTDSVRSGRRDLGFPDTRWGRRRKRLHAGSGGRPVRHEDRTGLRGAATVH